MGYDENVHLEERNPLKTFLVCLCATLLLCVAPYNGFSEVIVYDLVSPQAQKAMLKVETRGAFFHKGGTVVNFLIDGKSIGSVLSGGDGFAYKQFTPQKCGVYRINAKSGTDEDYGTLLSLKKGTGIVFVDLESNLFGELFSRKIRHGSQKAIKDINRRFPVVFLYSSITDTKEIKTWLEEYGFPALPVLPWDEGKTFDEMVKAGFRVKAVIGSPEIIESAKEYHTQAFTFQESEDAQEVKDWEEVRRRLLRE